MNYANREGSGVTHDTRQGQKKDPIVERIMLIAERLVAAEREIAELKKKVK